MSATQFFRVSCNIQNHFSLPHCFYKYRIIYINDVTWVAKFSIVLKPVPFPSIFFKKNIIFKNIKINIVR